MKMQDEFDDFEDNLDLNDPEPSNENDLFEDLPSEENIFEENNSNVQDSLILDLLKAKGIKDSKIIIIDENDEQKEVDFFTLSKEDQLEILSEKEEVIQNNSGDELEELNNYLKDNNLSLQEYLKLYEEAIIEKVKDESQPIYKIDSYNDEELYLLDLKNRYDDLTDDELAAELAKELENKELFTKKITKLRSEYKQLEDNYNQEQEKNYNEERETKYNEFVDTMVDVAVNTTDLYGIDLEDEEKNNVLSFLLELDDNGTSEFYKSLDNPENLYKAAWFLTYGQQAFDAIKDAYEAEIVKIKKDIPQIVLKKQKQSNSIHDL